MILFLYTGGFLCGFRQITYCLLCNLLGVFFLRMSKTVQSPQLEGMYRIYMAEFYATRVITYFLNDEEAQSFSAWPFCLASSASMQIMLKEQYLTSTDHNHTPKKILHTFFTSKRMVTLSGTFIHMESVNIYTHTHTFSSDFPIQSQLQISCLFGKLSITNVSFSGLFILIPSPYALIYSYF